MAFSKLTLNPGASPGARGKAPVVHTYASSTDTLATIAASSYFDTMAYALNTGDVIYVNGSDGSRWFEITSSSGTVTTAPIGDDLVVLTDRIADVSTAGQIYIVAPYALTIVAVYSALNGAIATSNGTLTVKTAAGTVGTLTITQSGSAAGDIDSLTSGLANTSVAAGAAIEVETNGASTNTISAGITVLARRA
jgi:hypothetical protein